MSHRRLVGIDLGIASAHTVRVLREDGSEVCRRRCWPRLDSLLEVEAAALAGAPPDLRLEVVIEPTGPAWLPIAVFFTGRGHTVYRVSSAKAADLRRFLSRHAKSNSIDAATLARLPLVDPGGLRPLRLPERDAASLDRRVRATDRLTRQAAEHKRRLKDLVRQLLPMTPLQGDLGKADLAVLERTGAHPRRLLAMGRARLSRLISRPPAGTSARSVRRPGSTPPTSRSNSTATIPPSPSTTAPPRCSPRSASSMPPRPSCPVTNRLANRHTARSTRTSSLAACLASPPSGDRRWPPWSATPTAFPMAPASAPSPAWPPGPPRPARPTAKASPCPRPALACSAPPCSAPPTTPATSTPSSHTSTTSRSSNAAPAISRRSVSSPPTWASAPGRCSLAALPTSSAMSTARCSRRKRPRLWLAPGRYPTTSASVAGARRPASRAGRPLTRSTRDMQRALAARKRGDLPQNPS